MSSEVAKRIGADVWEVRAEKLMRDPGPKCRNAKASQITAWRSWMTARMIMSVTIK